jgi:hypothetical protein
VKGKTNLQVSEKKFEGHIRSLWRKLIMVMKFIIATATGAKVKQKML